MTHLSKPLLVFDGDCDVCRAWMVRWRRATKGAVDDAPYQDVGERFPHIPTAEFARAVHLVEPDGSWSRGAEAVFRSLAHARRGRLGWWLYRRVPPFAAASEWAYRVVATHRGALSLFTRRPSGGRRGS